MNFFTKHATATTSEPRDPRPPPGLTTEEAQLNDSVWKLYSPPDGKHDVEVIFFHGLQEDDYEDAFWKTWLAIPTPNNNEEVVWPKDWLSKRLPKARILSVSYYSIAKQMDGQGDVRLLGENLVQDIILNKKYDIGQDCPVFLVGHSLGGIVLKQFIVSAIDERDLLDNDQDRTDFNRIAKFLDNFKGAFFFGTPNGGLSTSMTTQFVNRLTNPSPVLKLLKAVDLEKVRINEDFCMHRHFSNWNAKVFGMGEGDVTNFEGFNGKVVPESTARMDVDRYFTYSKGNHFTICKARNMKDFSHWTPCSIRIRNSA